MLVLSRFAPPNLSGAIHGAPIDREDDIDRDYASSVYSLLEQFVNHYTKFCVKQGAVIVLLELKEQIEDKQQMLSQMWNGVKVVNVLDADGRLLQSSLERHLILGTNGFVPHDVFELCHERDIPILQQVLTTVAETKQRNTCVLRVRHQNGTYITVLAYIESLIENDEVPGYVTMWRQVKEVRLEDVVAELEIWRIVESRKAKRTS